MKIDWLDRLLFSDRGHHVLLSLSLSMLMAAVWGFIFRLFNPENSAVASLIVFLVMFGVLVRGNGEADD